MIFKIIDTFVSRRLKILLAGVSLALTGCTGPYEVQFNDRVVYDPYPDENSEYSTLLNDANLQACLNAVLSNTENPDYKMITVLACPDAGISSLKGIAELQGLEQVELSGNEITDLSALRGLNKLKVINLSTNLITDIRPLESLPVLSFVSLQGNSNIPCRQLARLEEKLSTGFNRPETCAN